MQETHASPSTAKFFRAEWGGPMHFAHGTNKSKGVTIAFKKELSATVKFEIADPEGCYLLLVVEIEGKRILLANIYGPNEDRVEFFEEVFEKIHTEIRADEVIIGGDLNVYLDPKLDRKGGNPKMSRSACLLNEYLEHFEYLDVWRYLLPEKFVTLGSRLDPS